MIILNWMLAKYRKSPGFGAIMMIMITIMIMIMMKSTTIMVTITGAPGVGGS